MKGEDDVAGRELKPQSLALCLSSDCRWPDGSKEGDTVIFNKIYLHASCCLSFRHASSDSHRVYMAWERLVLQCGRII